MAIEKVFAIRATPAAIFDAIERDLASASEHEGRLFDVIAREYGKSIDLRVTIAGIPCRLTYMLEPGNALTEVTGRLVPYGWRYTAFRIMTFGLRDQNFAVALVEALANLKAAAESEDAG